jgi:hypothetical protein
MSPASSSSFNAFLLVVLDGTTALAKSCSWVMASERCEGTRLAAQSLFALPAATYKRCTTVRVSGREVEMPHDQTDCGCLYVDVLVCWADMFSEGQKTVAAGQFTSGFADGTGTSPTSATDAVGRKGVSRTGVGSSFVIDGNLP